MFQRGERVGGRKYGILCRVAKVATVPFLEVTDPSEAIGLWSRQGQT